MDVEQRLRDELRGNEWGATPWAAPLPRLRQRLRRRRRIQVAGALAVVVCGAVVAASVIAPRGPSVGDQTVVPTIAHPNAPASTPELTAGGIGHIAFGTTDRVAQEQLSGIFGTPRQPIKIVGNQCNWDASTEWPGLTAYYLNKRFVGYQYEGTRHGDELRTSDGLYIGESFDKAQASGGSSFGWSYAQGGSWSLQTSQGKLMGYLTAEPPHARIRTIDAGSVGCPAMTP